MFRELLDFIVYKLKQIVTSRLFPVTSVFLVLFSLLFARIYRLQVLEGATAQQDVESITKKTVSLEPTRGNIYDRNGTLLAYNQLVQNVTVMDDGSYANGYERNQMLLRLINLLDRFGETVYPSFDIYCDEEGHLQERFTSENARLRFLRDMYGKASISLLTDEEKATTADEIVAFYADKFGVGQNEDKTTYVLDNATTLKLLYIRYSMYANFYVRYRTSTVAVDVSEKTIAAIREHASELKGVDIAQSTKRVYNDAVYLCHILGYTGYASADEIEELNALGGSYTSGDIIGKTGIEASMELALHGTAGSQTMYVNNLGQIKQVTERTEPVAGDDIYLSIDVELQKGIYYLLEQKLAGILINHLKNEDVDPGETDHFIPIKQAYYQLINNNVLELELFADPDSGDAQKRIYYHFAEKQQQVLEDIRRELLAGTARNFSDLSEEMQAYFTEMYDVLLDEKLLLKEKVNTDSEIYRRYRQEGSVSLQTYLRSALEQDWIDVTLLELEDKYSSSEQVYQKLVPYVIELLRQSRSFSKTLYRKLIYDGTINRCDIALALYEQGILKADPEYENKLKERTPEIAFDFMIDKLNSIEITPAQLSLDPYSASATVVDIATGKVLAMVSYPGYDNNRISENGYYASLLNDQSTPLFNSATQARTAPGSIFKMVTTAAVLENHIIGPQTYIATHGIFSAAGIEVRCWSYPESHGDITASEALMVSCNDFFSQMGYRLSLVDSVYTDSVGVGVLADYAQRLGLGEKSGVEIEESTPVISDTSALTSAIGQGTHLYSCVHLARYCTALATRGNIYNLTLLDHRTAADGVLVQSYRGELVSKTVLDDSTWDTIWVGMRRTVTEGNHAGVFSQKVAIAGKTGTAEENKLRPDHATFISFAPYDDPEITVSVTIPNGYTSGNTAEMGGYIYDYYYGIITLEDILTGHARDRGGNEYHD